jgi:hypothetical protein
VNRVKDMIYFVKKPNVHYQSIKFEMMGITTVFTNVVNNIFLSRNDQQYALIIPLLYSIYWLLHVPAIIRELLGSA